MLRGGIRMAQRTGAVSRTVQYSTGRTRQVRVDEADQHEQLLACVQRRGQQQLARFLQEGANPNFPCDADGRTPLMVAVGAGWVDGTNLLLAWGANPNAVRRCHAAIRLRRSEDGRTAFHDACHPKGLPDTQWDPARWVDWASCAELLVWGGCDVSRKDRAGKTGLQLAKQHHRSESAFVHTISAAVNCARRRGIEHGRHVLTAGSPIADVTDRRLAPESGDVRGVASTMSREERITNMDNQLTMEWTYASRNAIVVVLYILWAAVAFGLVSFGDLISEVLAVWFGPRQLHQFIFYGLPVRALPGR